MRQQDFCIKFWTKMRDRHLKNNVDILVGMQNGVPTRYSIKACNTQPLGAAFFYVIPKGKSCRVELYINNSNSKLNSEYYEFLFKRKNEIENKLVFNWEPLPNRTAKRISYCIPDSIDFQEQPAKWERIQDDMIKGMRCLIASTRKN